MTEAKHTPGPWLQYADTNIVICKWRGPGAESLRVCEVSTNTRDDEGRHNLNLITAAPELLEAVRRLLVCNIEENRNIPGSAGAIRCARDALAKAAGDEAMRPETTYEKSARWNWPDGRPDL